MGGSLSEYVHRCNLANYTRLLHTEPTGPRRTVLKTLLEEEARRALVHGWVTIRA